MAQSQWRPPPPTLADRARAAEIEDNRSTQQGYSLPGTGDHDSEMVMAMPGGRDEQVTPAGLLHTALLFVLFQNTRGGLPPEEIQDLLKGFLGEDDDKYYQLMEEEHERRKKERAA